MNAVTPAASHAEIVANSLLKEATVHSPRSGIASRIILVFFILILSVMSDSFLLLYIKCCECTDVVLTPADHKAGLISVVIMGIDCAEETIYVMREGSGGAQLLPEMSSRGFHLEKYSVGIPGE